MVNQNGLDPPRQLRKVVNPNGLDPPDQLGPKEELDLVASEGATGMQNQEMASGGEQSIICTGVRNVQSQEVPSGSPVTTELARLTLRRQAKCRNTIEFLVIFFPHEQRMLELIFFSTCDL
ncbi:hypothetical protein PoB_005980600 [Plakobranchus ocellatus]|uniref:Uncharacterized protein n=1 Tax=Plakobranchus ocellatus TaxID=259542 RepID=A0AAV4CMV7_9GAST|nr:hypothetical protein PoB_005980600 [Plakobranchus ocellatus]